MCKVTVGFVLQFSSYGKVSFAFIGRVTAIGTICNPTEGILLAEVDRVCFKTTLILIDPRRKRQRNKTKLALKRVERERCIRLGGENG